MIGIQFVPVERTNPPSTGMIDAPEEVMVVLRRSCFDCHSNETVWPWYSYVAPVSWLVADDVLDGRRHLNFSEWSTYIPKRQNHKRTEIGEMVEVGIMPLWFYVPLHPKAEMSEDDIALLVAWSLEESQ
jgi:cytochrome c551/c552